MTKAGHSILKGAREAMEFASGAVNKKNYRVHIPETVDVESIRKHLGLSQTAFALRYGFNVTTLRQWEKGLRNPTGHAKAFLLTIAKEPQAVDRALALETAEHKKETGRQLKTGGAALKWL